MLLSFTVAVLAGLVAGFLLPYVPLLVLFSLALSAIVMTVLERLGRVTAWKGLVLYGGLLSGVLYWTVFTCLTSGSALGGFIGTDPVRVTGTIVEPIRQAPGRAVLVLSVLHLEEGGHTRPVGGRVRLTWREPDSGFGQGDLADVTARLRPPSGTVNPGLFDYGTYLRRQGIDAVASVSGPGQVMRLRSPSVLSRWGLWRVVDGWRERIRQAAVATLSGSALGIYLGIIVGEPGYLTQELRDAFMTTGTVHILSISGSHLGLIAFLSFFLMKGACHQLPDSWLQTLSRRVTPTRLAAATTTIPVAFYTLLAGSEVATVRSLVMIVLFLLAVWLGRAQQLLLAIASAALLIVVHDPRALFDISFQLSFCSVLAIALVVRWKVDESERDVRRPASFGSRAGAWLRGYAWVTGGVTLATMPLVAHHFNQIAWLGLAANLVVVPLAGFVLVPLGLASAVGVLLSGWNELPGGLLNQVGLDLMSNMVHLLARIPGAEWHIASPAILSMAGFYGLLYVTIRSEENRLLRWTSVAVIVLLLAWWAWSPHRAPDDGALFVTFLDVGQGDASLIELPDGRTVLIDGGATYETLDMGRAVVGPYLWNRGIAHLDYVIGTHPQLDHVGGLAWVLRSFGVGQYWGNGIGRAETFYRRLRGTLVDRSLHERVAQEGQAILDSGPCRLLVLNPPREEGIQNERRVESGTLLNNLSVVTRLDCGLHSFLFPADIEAEALARLRESDASAGIGVVKVPHHGARGSLDAQWIDRVDAQVAVISVGSHNPYGHPAAEVLAAYEERGVKLYRTDRDGAILVTARANSPDIKVRAARELRPQPVRLNQAMSRLFASERRNLVCLWMQWVGLWDC